MTLAEAMALAVLRGDEVAARALADLLLEGPGGVTPRRTRAGAPGRPLTSWEAFAAPEFRAFAELLGVRPWDERTVALTISLRFDSLVQVVHEFYPSPQAGGPTVTGGS